MRRILPQDEVGSFSDCDDEVTPSAPRALLLTANSAEYYVEERWTLGFKLALAGSWIVCFALGCFGASQVTTWPSSSRTEAYSELQPEQYTRWSGDVRDVSQGWQRQQQPWAYVMIADDPPEKSSRPSLWAAMALARSIQQFTAHRMVLLTNYQTFPDGIPVKASFEKLGVEVRPFTIVNLPEHLTKPVEFRASFHKFQAWNLVDLEKVVWLDSDALAYRSLDWLFLREGMWGGRHDWDCKLGQPFLNSAILSLVPSQQDYDGLVALARQSPHLSVHQVIVQYFRDVQRPVSLLTDLEAAYGRCMNSGVPSPYISKEGQKVNGLWSTADYVHKSGGYGQQADSPYDNICFTHDITSQKYYVGKAVLNICQFHPLGAHWRMLFCEAAASMGIQELSVRAFCNDHCYYWGVEDAGYGCDSGPIDGTPVYGEYYSHVTGIPGPEMAHSPRS